jgi:hypothetical protein
MEAKHKKVKKREQARSFWSRVPVNTLPRATTEAKTSEFRYSKTRRFTLDLQTNSGVCLFARCFLRRRVS